MSHRAQPGFTLTEILISILITAIIVLSVFAVSITAKRSVVKYDLRVAANNGARLILGKLGNYVTADPTIPNVGPNNGAWTLPNDVCGGCSHALEPGYTHDVSAYLPAYLRNTPYPNMTMKYTVVDLNASGPVGFSVFVPSVTVTVEWTELSIGI